MGHMVYVWIVCNHLTTGNEPVMVLVTLSWWVAADQAASAVQYCCNALCDHKIVYIEEHS